MNAGGDSTLVYDGDCAFCTASVRWVSRLHLAVDTVVPYQEADLAALRLSQAQCVAAVQLVVGDRAWSGHAALGRLLLRSAWFWRPLGAVLLVPPGSWLGRAVYRWVAGHRHVLPGGTAACVLPPEQRPKAS